MECRDCEPQLIDYTCMQPDDPVHAEITRHLASCPDCALEYCRLRADLAGIVEAHAEAPHARVYHRLRRRVAAEVGERWWTRSRRLLLRPIPIYGAVLASLVPLALWLTGLATIRQSPPTPTRELAAPHAELLRDYDAIALPQPLRDVL